MCTPSDNAPSPPVLERRDRQLREIESMVRAGRHDRARDLVRLHLAEFPADAPCVAALGLP